MSREWNLAFRRRLYDSEEVDLARLLNHLISGPEVRLGHIDKIVWSASPSSEFSVSSVYKSVVNSLGPYLKISKLVLLNYIPPKVQIFGWLAWKKKVKTKEFLHKVGVLNGNNSTVCVFCNIASESVDHVLIYCPFVWQIWANIMNLWDVQGAIPSSVDQLLVWWAGGMMKKMGVEDMECCSVSCTMVCLEASK